MKTIRPRRAMKCCVAVIFLLAGWPTAVFAGWSGFLRLDGVIGESADTNHIGWMDVTTVATINVSNNPSPPIGVPGGLTNGSLCFLKRVDKASPTLMLKCAQGTTIPTGSLDLTTTNSSLVRFLQLNLSNITITSVSPAGSANDADDRPRESLCLLAQFASWKYTQFSVRSGLAKENVSSQWNFQTSSGGSNSQAPVFLVTGIQRTGGIELSWPATTGRHYRIYAVQNLDAPFTPINEVAATATGTMTQNLPANAPSMFFVVEELQ